MGNLWETLLKMLLTPKGKSWNIYTLTREAAPRVFVPWHCWPVLSRSGATCREVGESPWVEDR